MNRNFPRQEHRECKHTAQHAVMEPSARCAIPQRRYPCSYSYAAKDSDKHEHRHHHGVRSQSIPICQAALRRTASELKLCEDEATADFQDYIFFSRLLNGISRQQQKESVSDKFLRESDECLAHIIGTRNGSLDNLQSVSSASDYLHRSLRYDDDEQEEGIFLMEDL